MVFAKISKERCVESIGFHKIDYLKALRRTLWVQVTLVGSTSL